MEMGLLDGYVYVCVSAFLSFCLFCLTVHLKNSRDVCDELVFMFTLSKRIVMIDVMSFSFFMLNVVSLFFLPFDHDKCDKFILSSI